MTLPIGQEFVITTSASPFNCDISTNAINGKHIRTAVGGMGQSAICWDCAEAIYRLVAGERTKAARAARISKSGPLAVSAA